MRVLIITRNGVLLHYGITEITDTKLSELERTIPIDTIKVIDNNNNEVPLGVLLNVIDTLNHITMRQIKLHDK